MEKRLQSQDKLTYSKLLVNELPVNEVSKFCKTVIMHNFTLIFGWDVELLAKITK